MLLRRVTGYDLEGVAKENDGIIHLINSGACCLDASGVVKDENGEGVMKEWWERYRRRSESHHESY